MLYGFDQITFNNGTVAGDGSGTTIAIVDAYDDPNIANDLHQFDAQFGLPDPVFTKVNQTGGTTHPAANKGWATEIALDVEWAARHRPEGQHPAGRGQQRLVQRLAHRGRLCRAVPAGVVAVSMSWGGGEFSGENRLRQLFHHPQRSRRGDLPGVLRRQRRAGGYPAISPNVVAVGGTTLEPQQPGQLVERIGLERQRRRHQRLRKPADLSEGRGHAKHHLPHQPRRVVRLRPEYRFPGLRFLQQSGTATPWGQWGGTSDAAPQWAALIAIADQGRVLAGKGSLDGATQTLPLLYSLSSTDFHDITSGTSTGSPAYSAGPGYDLVTGRGTPSPTWWSSIWSPPVRPLLRPPRCAGADHLQHRGCRGHPAGRHPRVE